MKHFVKILYVISTIIEYIKSETIIYDDGGIYCGDVLSDWRHGQER